MLAGLAAYAAELLCYTALAAAAAAAVPVVHLFRKENWVDAFPVGMLNTCCIYCRFLQRISVLPVRSSPSAFAVSIFGLN